MEAVLGTSVGVFLGITVALMGFAAWMTGRALAETWKPMWLTALYCVLLGFGDRFLVFALFDGALLSPSGYLVDTAVLVAIGLLAHRLGQARKMVSQYPWLYVKAGPFAWRERGPGDR